MNWMKRMAVLAVSAGVACAAIAQEPEQREQRDRRPTDDQRRQFEQRGRAMMAQMQPGSIFATDKYVYVLKGNMLYQFKADDLEPMKKAEIPQPPAPVEPQP